MASIRIESGNEYDSKPPKGAKILKHTVSTSIEKIKNGFLVTKSHHGKYQTGKNLNDYSYFDYSEKEFTEENPVQLKKPVDMDLEEDSELASMFPEPKEKD